MKSLENNWNKECTAMVQKLAAKLKCYKSVPKKFIEIFNMSVTHERVHLKLSAELILQSVHC